ncbi:MAG: MBL fold metallo-hydrolase [Candidatus Thorarchaeota archaeon]|jgi:glyoxylase-like metal-dependent hydrolase (beta-lactamase superfamily II)
MTFNKYLSEISDGVLLFTAPRTRVASWRRSGNVAILPGERGVVLVDSGGNAAKEHLLRLLRSILDGRSQEVHCVHTHGHIDHIAGDPTLIDRFQAEIWASEEAIPYVRAQVPILIEREHSHMVASFRELFSAPEWFVKGVMRLTMGRSRPIDSIQATQNGDELMETGFHPLQLPGHHPGHIGFFKKEDNVLIAGDLLDPRHRMKPGLTAPSSDFTSMRETLESVLKLSPRILVLGHGNPLIGEESVRRAVEQSLETLDRAERKVIDCLESAPMSLGDLSSELQRLGLGPGDVFRRMFIHSTIKHLLGERRISRKPIEKRRVEFSVS